MTQQRHRGDGGQGNLVQTGQFVTKTVKRVQRLAGVLGLAGMVATAAVLGLGAPTADAAGYLWAHWVHTSDFADAYLACIDEGGTPYLLAEADYYGRSCIAGLACYWQLIACYR